MAAPNSNNWTAINAPRPSTPQSTNPQGAANPARQGPALGGPVQASSRIDFTPIKYMSAETIRKSGGKYMYRDIVNNRYVYFPLSHSGSTSASLLQDYGKLTSGAYQAVPVRSTVSGKTFYEVRSKTR